MKTKARKATPSRRAKDLAVKGTKSRSVKGGAVKTSASTLDIVKVPAPSGPVPIPYPN
jgi:hypothetical protein